MVADETWSQWRPFPSPNKRGILVAPFGPGCYELRRRDTGRKILFGRGSNVAFRMTSLLPSGEGGAGERTNKAKREYVLKHLAQIDYRTCACADRGQAIAVERELLRKASEYLFDT
jgi:hypothetical protein